MGPPILLLQARRLDDPARPEEVESFARMAGVEAERIATHDLLAGPPSLATVRAHAAVMIGGSGEHYVSKRNLPTQSEVCEFLRELVDAGHPTFASCFGFQLMVEALGGEIVHDPDNTEVGTYVLELTDAGRADPLLGTLPATFQAQVGRKDRAESLPVGVTHLASSARCPFQAMRIDDKPIWATQFHPELDRSSNRRRFVQYLDGYAPFLPVDEREAALNLFDESSPEVHELLRAFLQLVID